MIDLREIQFSKPKKYQTYSIKSGEDVLIIREPFSADHAEIEQLKKEYSDNSHYFYMAVGILLAESFNGVPMNPVQIGSLNSKAFAELRGKIDQFQLDILPDFYKDQIPSIMKKFIEGSLQSENLSFLNETDNSGVM